MQLLGHLRHWLFSSERGGVWLYLAAHALPQELLIVELCYFCSKDKGKHKHGWFLASRSISE